MITHNICLSLSDFFHLAWHHLGPSLLLQMTKFILFYGWVVFHCFYIHYIFFIHSSVDGYLESFHILAIVNNGAMNVAVHVSFQISVFIFFRYISRSGIIGSYGSSNFSFLRKLQYTHIDLQQCNKDNISFQGKVSTSLLSAYYKILVL